MQSLVAAFAILLPLVGGVVDVEQAQLAVTGNAIAVAGPQDYWYTPPQSKIKYGPTAPRVTPMPTPTQWPSPSATVTPTSSPAARARSMTVIPACSGGPIDAPAACGSAATNHIKNRIVAVTTAQQLQPILDTYYVEGNDGCSGTAWNGQTWGHHWLSKYTTYLLAMKAYELRNQLSAAQKTQLEEILQDAALECRLYLDGCAAGTGNTCAEDYVGMVMLQAAVKNLFPNVPVDPSLEERYLNKAFGLGDGLVREQKPWDNQEWTKLYNHGEENPVYGNVVLIHTNNARYTYQLAGKSTPDFYRNQNQLDLFKWIQSKTLPDGSSFDMRGCHTVNGTVVPCYDSLVARAKPTILPGGRIIKALFGAEEVNGGFSFEVFNDEGAGGNYDVGRRTMYDIYNPPSSTRMVRRRLSANINASVSYVRANSPVKLTWNSADTTTCRAKKGPFDTDKKTQGWTWSEPLQKSTTFTIECEGNGKKITASTRVTVRPERTPTRWFR